MNNKFRDKYRINSARLAGYNYNAQGMYFITICVGGRECHFGHIENDTMHLSDAGNIVYNEWMKTPEIRPDMNLTLDVFCVMPNHFHAILIIGKNQYNHRDAMICRDAMHRVSTNHRVSTDRLPTDNGNDTDHGIKYGINPNNIDIHDQQPQPYQNQYGPQRKNLASIMRGFKSTCTNQIRQYLIPEFYWQERFHDHIIRNNESYWKIRNYIINNPKNWYNDRFYDK